MGEAAGRLSDILVITSDNPRTEDPDKIIEDILPGVPNANYHVIADRRSAIQYACSIASSGDTIMIAGKGHEDYQIIGTEKIHFDDREEVEIALREWDMWNSGKIAEILQCKLYGSSDTPFHGCAIDSRKVVHGEAFVAIRGEQTDGHHYIGSAFQNGASIVIAEAARLEVLGIPEILLQKPLLP
jgi:UDP-N-acetylmuramyl tripeptide synthase